MTITMGFMIVFFVITAGVNLVWPRTKIEFIINLLFGITTMSIIFLFGICGIHQLLIP